MTAAPGGPPAAHGFPTQVVGAAILDDARSPQRFLAAQRAYPPALRGLWELPGGKVEAREDPRDALRRECLEELGVVVRLLREVEGPHPQGWPLSDSAAMRVWTAVVEDDARRPDPTSRRPVDLPLPDGPRPEGADHLRLLWVPIARAGSVAPESPAVAEGDAGSDPPDDSDPAWIPADLPIVAALRSTLTAPRAD